MITSIYTVTQVSIKVRKRNKVNKNIGIIVEHNTNDTYEYDDKCVRIWKRREMRICLYIDTYAGIRIKIT